MNRREIKDLTIVGIKTIYILEKNRDTLVSEMSTIATLCKMKALMKKDETKEVNNRHYKGMMNCLLCDIQELNQLGDTICLMDKYLIRWWNSQIKPVREKIQKKYRLQFIEIEKIFKSIYHFEIEDDTKTYEELGLEQANHIIQTLILLKDKMIEFEKTLEKEEVLKLEIRY